MLRKPVDWGVQLQVLVSTTLLHNFLYGSEEVLDVHEIRLETASATLEHESLIQAHYSHNNLITELIYGTVNVTHLTIQFFNLLLELIDFNCELRHLLTCLVAQRFDLVDVLYFALASLEQVHVQSVDFLKVLLKVAELQKQILIFTLKVAGLFLEKLCFLSELKLVKLQLP